MRIESGLRLTASVADTSIELGTFLSFSFVFVFVFSFVFVFLFEYMRIENGFEFDRLFGSASDTSIERGGRLSQGRSVGQTQLYIEGEHFK